MIVDTLGAALKNPLYGPQSSLPPNFSTAFTWLQSIDPMALTDGRHEIDGTRVFALAQRNLAKDYGDTKWEAHKNYADIQYIVQGQERMEWQSLDRSTLGDYNPEKDFQALDAVAGGVLTLGAGQFAIFMPTDSHRPAIKTGSGDLYKIVVKVLL